MRPFIRKLLARSGYIVTRPDPEAPPSFPSHLAELRSRKARPESVICFANDPLLQSELLDAFAADRAAFLSPDASMEQPPAVDGAASRIRPPGRFLAVVDLETFAIGPLVARHPWMLHAESIVLQARLGSFWSGHRDIGDVERAVRDMKFQLADVIDSARFCRLHASSGRVLFVCERASGAAAQTTSRRYRINEAFAFLARPAAQPGDFRLLAGRGSFGFAAGVFNPGSLVIDGTTYLVPRAERAPWPLVRRDESLYFGCTQPLLLALDANDRIASAGEMRLEGMPDASRCRTMDFRTFAHRGERFVDFAVSSNPGPKVVARRPLRIGAMTTRMGIARLDVHRRRMTWRGHPVIDRKEARTEKNWAFFSDDDRLYLLYSFSPYVLLRAANWPDLGFETVCETAHAYPFGGDGMQVRNSVNPVDYDDDHWLHIVHKVYPGKQYAFWAVLIDKRNLQPARITARPLALGGRSHSASILYICSAVCRDDDILLFAGLDDAATAVCRIARARLDAEWVSLAAAPGIRTERRVAA